METSASKFEQVEGDLKKLLNDLMNQLEGLRGAWAGQSARSFDNVKEAFTQQQNKLSSALLETANGVRSSGKNYTASDQETAGSMNNINIPNLPL